MSRRPVRCDAFRYPTCAEPATHVLTRPSGMSVRTCDEHLELTRHSMRHWVGSETEPRQADEVAL